MQVIGNCESRLGRLTLSVAIDLCETNNGIVSFTPGQTICGVLDVTFIQQTFVRGIWIKFCGMNKLISSVGSSGDSSAVDSNTSVDLLENHDDYHLGGIYDVVLGLGEERRSDYNELLDMQAGDYSFPFSILIPSNLPLTFIDESMEVLYTLNAVLDTPVISKSITQIQYNMILGSIGAIHELYQTPCDVLGTQPIEEMFNMRSNSLFSCLPSSFQNKLTISMSSGAAVYDFRSSHNNIKIDYKLASINTTKLITIKAELYTEMTIYKQSIAALSTSRENNGNKLNKTIKTYKIWEKLIDIPNLNRGIVVEGELTIPIIIDTSTSTSCLLEWPKPAAIPHKNFISFCSTSGPLFYRKTKIRISVMKQKEHSKYTQICPPYTKEIFVRPPINAADFSIPSSPPSSPSHASRIPFCRATNSGFLVADSTDNAISHSGSSITADTLVMTTAVVAKTPHAVPAKLKVQGQLVSKGPAAVLMDRNLNRMAQFNTPRQYVNMYRIIQNPAIVVGTPSDSPALAYLYNEDGSNCENIDSSNNYMTTINYQGLTDDEDEDEYVGRRVSNFGWSTPAQIIGVRRRAAGFGGEEIRAGSPTDSRTVTAQLFPM